MTAIDPKPPARRTSTRGLKKLAKLVRLGDTVLVDEYSGSLARACGELSYQVGWDNIRAEQYLTLLPVYATTFNDVGSAAYIRDLMETKPEPNPLTSPRQGILAYHQAEDDKQNDPGMAGQKVDENSWIL